MQQHMSYRGDSGGGQTNGDLNGNKGPSVMWQERRGSAVALYKCILTLPIQKAHIYTHTTKR